ncbi:Disulfide bond formation protein B [Vibrio stylophorae]|uniref:Disulfide bond formation protein B n=1 Tax=Vibrio stylophorae TaxID=659351 RepID=A0ABN8DV35_9VIBR|nr:disulfide bond formation protein DsbB [Vibrio stylophorae]CAH0533861.1 Disulfide bond formation protein B [Vibrio stylophorae]
MNILTSLYRFSTLRISWFLLALVTFIFELCALYFQHGLNLAPCVMCIYERVAMIGLTAAGLIGMIAPRFLLVRLAGFGLWGYSSYHGAVLSWQHVAYQFDPSPFHQCPLFVTFPDWLPLNQWLPSVFEATGDCSKVVWQFMGLSMPQWLQIIFAVSIAVCAIFLLLQPLRFIKNK